MVFTGDVAPVGDTKGEVRTGVWWVELREREYLEDLGVGGRLLKWILGARFGSMDWINPSMWSDKHCSSQRKLHLSWSFLNILFQISSKSKHY
jgi:hypothetical protein